MPKRYVMVLVAVLVVGLLAALLYSSMLQSNSNAGFEQQRIIETQNAQLEATASNAP